MQDTIDITTDAGALALLEGIAAYAREYGNGGDPHLRVGELAGDLIDSLPRGAVPVGTRAAIESTFNRHSLS